MELMISIVKWIKVNIVFIKEFSGIVFTSIATVIAILTYRRARYTLLQPLRSEVIKRQTDLFVSLLDFIRDKEHRLIDKIGYRDIVFTNMYYFSKECDFYLEGRNDDERVDLEQKIQANISGYVVVKKSGQLKHVWKLELFDSPPHKCEDDLKQEQRENMSSYINGVFDNDLLAHG